MGHQAGRAADALKFDIRWKVACGRSLTQMSFDPSTLVCWRKRIAKSSRPDRVFDAVAQVIAQTGILAGKRRRVIGSTVLDDAVVTQDTVTQLTAAVRKVARVVPGAGEVIAGACTLDYRTPGKPVIDWDDPQAKDNLVSDLVNDALARLTGDDAPRVMTRRRTRWACWPWLPGRTSSPPGTRTAPTGGGGSPQGRPRPDDQHGGP